MYNSPFLRQNTSVRRVMVTVLIAMLPAIAVQVWLFGIGVLLHDRDRQRGGARLRGRHAHAAPPAGGRALVTAARWSPPG
jgi:Na+-transporting NADH:ubiquinone oxidoreductase subunit NqrB